MGFVLNDGTVIECENISSTPEESFQVAAEEIIKYCDDATATWHTHPNSDNNLSAGDYETFMSWPNLAHYIIGTNGVREYYVKDGELLIA